MSQPIRVLSGEDIKQALSMAEAIDLMQGAFVQLSAGQAVVPVRLQMEMPEANGRALIMPVYLPDSRKLGAKFVAIMDDNPAKRLPLIHAMFIILDATTGKPLALMDGEYLTALRTGAASGLATRLLARPDSKIVVIIGAGAQARFQLEAICKVCPVEQAFILNRNPERAEQFAADISVKLAIPVQVAKSSTVLREADVICSATTSTQPVFEHRDLKPGVHINGVGSYKPTMCEVPPETVAAARLVVDHRKSCLSEAGDVVQAIKHGFISEESIHAELGEVAAGQKEGRGSETEITFFKSVGNAVQDLAAANHVLQSAEELDLGTEVVL